MKLRVPPPLIGLSIALLMWWIARLSGAALWPGGVPRFFGGTVMALGLVIDLISVAKFFQEKTTVNPLSPGKSTALVTSGLYRFSRNPMYLGMLLILIGWACIIGSLFSVPLLALFVVAINELQIKPEEAILETLFPEDYPAYCQRVRRWI